MHICYNCTFLYPGTEVPIQPGAWVNLYIYIYVCMYVCRCTCMHICYNFNLSLSRHARTHPSRVLGEAQGPG